MNVPTPTERTLSSAPHAAYASGFKRIAGFGIGTALLLLCIIASLMLGSKAIPFHTVWLSLQGAASGSDSTIILNARVPRTLAGILAGMALGAAGALIQALTRNPLADPGVLGINAGASFAVVIGIMFFGAATTESYMAYAFVGAALTTLLVYLIGTLAGGRINPVRLTLAGVAIGAVLLGITTGLSLIDPQTFDQLRFWQAGTLDIRTLSTLPVTAPAILLGCLLTLLIARPLNTIGMGEDLAIALGARVVLTQVVAVIAITLLCGAATATVGPISFIGLMVPHIARWWVGPDQRWILPYSMLLAPILLLCADVVGRLLAAGELRVSIVAAFIGAPVLIWLVRRKKTLGGCDESAPHIAYRPPGRRHQRAHAAAPAVGQYFTAGVVPGDGRCRAVLRHAAAFSGTGLCRAQRRGAEKSGHRGHPMALAAYRHGAAVRRRTRHERRHLPVDYPQPARQPGRDWL